MKNLILTGKITAGLSFIIGTILLALYLYFNHTNLIMKIGILYIIIAFCVNIILLVVLLIFFCIQTQFRLEILKTCGLMLLNLPIAFGYFILVIDRLNSLNNY